MEILIWIVIGSFVGVLIGGGIVKLYFLIWPMTITLTKEEIEADERHKKEMVKISGMLDDMLDEK